MANHSKSPQPPRQLPFYLLILIDCALVGVCLLIFALFDHVIPVKEADVPVVRATMQPEIAALAVATEAPSAPPQETPEGAEAEDAEPEPTPEPSPSPTPGVGDFSQKFADKFTDGEVIRTDTSYQSANLNVTLNRYEFNVGSYEQVAYVQDIYIRNIDCIHRAFAKDTYGKAITEGVLKMAVRNGAIAAINGDYYGHNNSGVVIRDGVMYRDDFSSYMQTLVLFRDGNMRCYRKNSEFDAKEVMAQGAWQSFSFGPALLDKDGEPFQGGYEAVNHDPRTIIGMVEPGHYMFIVIDGRQNGYSEGLTYEESAHLCKKLGCKVALNLDGGKTSQMTFMDKMANHPYKKGREISDIVYVAEP